MVGDIASDSESTSTTNDGEGSDKCESPLVVPGNTDFEMVDNTTSESEYLTDYQIFERLYDRIKIWHARILNIDESIECYW